MSAFDRLISQIDGFIRKFYKNQIVKGLVLFCGVLLSTYLLVVLLEYFGRFNSIVRATLLFGFLGTNIYILTRFIVIPTMKLRSFGPRIDRFQAAKIIGSFFPNVSDRLLNTLQLRDMLDTNSAEFELLNASVQQRSKKMSTIPFADAIDINENRRKAIWILPILLIMFAVGLLSPSIYTQGTNRVVNFTKEFPVEAPFKFNLLNTATEVLEGEDVPVEIELLGSAIPDKVFMLSPQGKILLTKTAKNKFEGTLKQLHKDTKYQFVAPHNGHDFKSSEHEVKVIAKTGIGKMQATILFPAYLGRDKEVIENASDLTVPEGAVVTWSVLTKNSSNNEFRLGSKKERFKKRGFKVQHKFLQTTDGHVVLQNDFNKQRDTASFVVEVIKDEFPSIQVLEVKDTLKDGIRYFSGMLSDDHGLASLTFHYTINREDGSIVKKSIKGSRVYGTESPFDFAVDFRREDVQLNDKIEYYFSVTDNDGVNGGKSTRSRMFTYKLPTLEELNDKRGEEQEEIKADIKDIMTKADEFKKNLEHLRKESLNSNNTNWNKENQVNQLQEQHQSIIEDLQNLQESMENSMEEKNQLSEVDEELLEQQEMIEDLLEELMDDELKDLLEQLEELLKEQNKDALEQNMEQLEMSSEEMKDQLDRSLEMLKKMQVNEKIDDLEDELNKLADEQEKLSEEVDNQKDISEEQKNKQEELNEKFDELKKDMKEIDSLNNELDRPMELGDMEKDSEEISEEMNEAGEKMDSNKGSKASESQKSAAKKMKQMASDLDAMQQESNAQQQQEDIDMLRNILESLVALSFDQELVMDKLERVSDNDPAFHKYSRYQRKIIDDTKIVRDSLNELAKRQPKIAQFIDKELNQIKVNQGMSLEDIDERRRRDLTIHQQYAMTSYNNLALMLNESLQQMQQQMQNMKPGSGSCNKPGGQGVPKPGEGMSPGNMKEMLKKQLEQMQKGDSPGKPGDKKPGKQGMGGMGMGNKQVAKMAAEQSAIRKRLEQLRKEMNKDGSGNGNKLSPLINELEEQERDLVHKRLDDNLIKRQKDILTRLLESEKAIMERGFDEKRESKEGKNDNYGNQIRFDEYNKEKLKQIELLRSVDPTYKKYYKDRANEYINRLL
jgi:hypothetical protein